MSMPTLIRKKYLPLWLIGVIVVVYSLVLSYRVQNVDNPPRRKLDSNSKPNDHQAKHNVKPIERVKMMNSGEERFVREQSHRERLKFVKFFKHWPRNKPKAAIYLFAYRMNGLEQMLPSLDLNFNNAFHYPVIIFHESSFYEEIPKIRRLTNSNVFFQLVTFRIPGFIRQPVAKITKCSSHPIGYRHMCRFHAKTVYEEPTIRMLDYYWRLDNDSLFLGPPIEYDVFAFMVKNRLQYGYSIISLDNANCVAGLWNATKYYTEQKNMHPKFELKERLMFDNNFEISSTALWFSQQYQDYVDYLDALGGIYHTRWGDAPIHSLAVSLFLDKNATHRFVDIGYEHLSHINRVL